MTAADLIKLALTDSGIVGQGQTASAVDTNNALTRLNIMLSQWAMKRWLVYNLTDVACVSTGAQSYTVGPGGAFNIPRPDKLEDGCFLRQLNSQGGQVVDYPLQLIQSHEDYAAIRLKSMGTFPSALFYDSGFPMGTLYPWPIAQSGIYELHILVKTPLNNLANLSAAVNLPPEYLAAILYNLQVRLRAAYRMTADPVIIGLARDALNVIRVSNTQIATLSMPKPLVGRGRAYNVYADV